MYVTPAQMADGSGALRECAELFELDPALLAATLAGGDRSAWTAEQQAAADAAVVTITDTITRAEGEMHAYLGPRGYTLPLDPVAFPVLTTWARAIARYWLALQRDLKTEDTGRVERDYRAALQQLRLVADGKIGLGDGDPLFGTGASSSGSPQVDPEAPARVFTRDSLAGF